jgi:hypothetical protein
VTYQPTVAQVATAERVVDASGLASSLDARLRGYQRRPGRPRELSMRNFLVGMFLVAESGTLHICRIAPMLNGMPTGTRKRLGLTRDGGVTDRQVQRLFATISAALRAAGIASLDELFDALCDATQPADADADATRSIAVDSTDIESWGRRRSLRSAKPCSDPDARWRGTQQAKSTWKNPLYGYDLTAAVTVPELDGPDVPLAARRVRLRPAAQDVGPTGLDVIAATAAMQRGLGDVVADRAYSKRHDGTDFALPVRALGGEPVFALMGYQLGVSGTVHGALIIDGNPFSPATPKNLRSLTPPPVGASVADIINYQQQVAQRAQYALVAHGKRNHNGDADYRCPAAAEKLRCPLVPGSLSLPMTVPTALTPPKPARKATVCAQATRRFAAADIPLAQRNLHGSRAWYTSWNRRNRVEGFFGNLKDEARESIRRGIVRVRTIEKVGMWLAFAVAAANERLAAAFKRRPAPVAPKRPRGRPRKPGLAAHLPAGVRLDAAANAPPGKAA